jgi:hypothetical protein
MTCIHRPDSGHSFYIGYCFLSLCVEGLSLDKDVLGILPLHDLESRNITQQLLNDIYNHQEIIALPTLLHLFCTERSVWSLHRG